MILRIIILLIINFAALGIGSLFTGPGVSSDWYMGLKQAPWTPPGWVFGFAWTTIMICFAYYMAVLIGQSVHRNVVIGLFSLQWILNVIWNPLFFKFHLTGISLIVIISLLVVVLIMTFYYWQQMGLKVLFIAPYAIWLMIASSLNLYIELKN